MRASAALKINESDLCLVGSVRIQWIGLPQEVVEPIVELGRSPCERSSKIATPAFRHDLVKRLLMLEEQLAHRDGF